VAMDDGTPIVVAGVVQPGADLNIAINNFSAGGGDQYPFRGAPFTTLGVTDQQTLSNYIQNGLGGLISAADYPEGGEGRITQSTTASTLAHNLFAGPVIYMPLATTNW
jgi:hypothetical protein